MAFETLAELREYKAKLRAAIVERATGGVSGTISGGGFTQSFTRSSLSELRAELQAVEDEERQMLGLTKHRLAYIRGI